MDSKGEKLGFVGYAFVHFTAVQQYIDRIANGSPSDIRRSIAQRIASGEYYRSGNGWYAMIDASPEGPAFDAFVGDAPLNAPDKRLPEVVAVYESGTFALRASAKKVDRWPYALTSGKPASDADDVRSTERPPTAEVLVQSEGSQLRSLPSDTPDSGGE